MLHFLAADFDLKSPLLLIPIGWGVKGRTELLHFLDDNPLGQTRCETCPAAANQRRIKKQAARGGVFHLDNVDEGTIVALDWVHSVIVYKISGPVDDEASLVVSIPRKTWLE